MDYRARQALGIAIALILTAAASLWSAQPPATEAAPPDLARMIPTRLAGWQADETLALQAISPEDAAKADAAYASTLERIYVDDQHQRIMLSVSYGSQRGKLQAHRPEFCYQAQGFRIGNKREETVATGRGPLAVRRIETHRPGRHEPVTYWMTIGEEAVLPGWQRFHAQIRQAFGSSPLAGFIVRISSIDESATRAYAAQDRFVVDLLAHLPESNRARLAGSGR